MATPPTTADDAGFDIVGMTDEVTSLDDVKVNAVDFFLMTNMYTLLENEGDAPDQPSPAWLHSEEDVAEAILFLEKLGVAPGKIHPARALQRAEAESTHSARSTTRAHPSWPSSSAASGSTRQHSLPSRPSSPCTSTRSRTMEYGDRSACIALGISRSVFQVWKSTLYGEKSKQYINNSA